MSDPRPGRVRSLSDACMIKIAWYLKRNSWGSEQWFKNKTSLGNPFARLPSIIIDDLLDLVVKRSASSQKLEQILRPLVTSGKIRHFNVKIKAKQFSDLVPLLGLLATYAASLKTLVLYTDKAALKRSRGSARGFVKQIEEVVKAAPELVVFRTNFGISARAFVRNTNLEVIRLEYYVGKRGAPPQVEKELNILGKNFQFKIDSMHQIIALLDNLPNLRVLDCEISRALETIMTRGMDDPTALPTYHLQGAFLNVNSVAQIGPCITLCPNLVELVVHLGSDSVIKDLHLLALLRHLRRLIFKEKKYTSKRNFSLFIPMFKAVGTRLMTLGMSCNVKKLDIGILATLCPNLEELLLDICHGKSLNPPEIVFKNLQILTVELPSTSSFDAITHGFMVTLLSHCSNLQRLNVQHVENLDDSVLHQILSKNSLANLKFAILDACTITTSGVLALVASAENLQFLQVSPKLEIAQTLREQIALMNPRLKFVNRSTPSLWRNLWSWWHDLL